jgi:hypothetical protein
MVEATRLCYTFVFNELNVHRTAGRQTAARSSPPFCDPLAIMERVKFANPKSTGISVVAPIRGDIDAGQLDKIGAAEVQAARAASLPDRRAKANQYPFTIRVNH